MHIIGPDQPARECEAKINGIQCRRTTRQLYGANNTPICMICKGRELRAAQARYNLPTAGQGEPQAIDAWEPGQKV